MHIFFQKNYYIIVVLLIKYYWFINIIYYYYLCSENLQPLGAKSPNIVQGWCQSPQTPQNKHRKSCTASWKKTQEVPFIPLPCDGKWLLPQAKLSVKCSFWNNPSLKVPETCFAKRLLIDWISWAASNDKTSEALSTQRTGWSASLPLLPPQVTSAQCHWHLGSTAIHPFKHLTKMDFMKL